MNVIFKKVAFLLLLGLLAVSACKKEDCPNNPDCTYCVDEWEPVCQTGIVMDSTRCGVCPEGTRKLPVDDDGFLFSCSANLRPDDTYYYEGQFPYYNFGLITEFTIGRGLVPDSIGTYSATYTFITHPYGTGTAASSCTLYRTATGDSLYIPQGPFTSTVIEGEKSYSKLRVKENLNRDTLRMHVSWRPWSAPWTTIGQDTTLIFTK